MDPLTIIVAITASVFATSSVGYAMGRRKERRTPALIESVGANKELQSRVQDLERELEWHNGEEDRKDEDIQRLTKQKDTYKAIAESHEVHYPDPPIVPDKNPWDKRRFCGHPSDNLDAMLTELQPYKGHEVQMTVRISGAGQFSTWGKIIEQNWKKCKKDGTRVPTPELGPWVYHGDVDRAYSDFETQILDDDSGFMEEIEDEEVWKDKDSPILFEVSLEIKNVAPPKLPDVHTVEVAVVEEVVIREVVDRPVYISVPEGHDAELCGHTSDQIHDHVREAMARAVAEEEVDEYGRLQGESMASSKSSASRIAGVEASSV